MNEQKELFLQQQKEINSYLNSGDFKIDIYYNKLIEYIKKGNFLLLKPAVDFLLTLHKQTNDSLYIKACYTLMNMDMLYYELMTYEEQVEYELYRAKAFTYYAMYVNSSSTRKAHDAIYALRYLIDDGSELYYDALIWAIDEPDLENNEDYLKNMLNYYLLGHDITFEEAKIFGFNELLFNDNEEHLLSVLKSPLEEKEKINILRTLVHLGNKDVVEELKKLDTLFDYDLYTYCMKRKKTPDNQKVNNDNNKKKSSPIKNSTNKLNTNVKNTKSVTPKNNETPTFYKNNFINVVKIIFLIPLTMYIITCFIEIPYIDTFFSWFISGSYISNNVDLGAALSQMILAFLPPLFIFLWQIRSNKNVYLYKKNMANLIIKTIFLGLLMSIISTIIISFINDDTEFLIDFSDFGLWASTVGITILSIWIPYIIIGLGNIFFDKCRKTSVWTTIISTILFLVLTVISLYVTSLL